MLKCGILPISIHIFKKKNINRALEAAIQLSRNKYAFCNKQYT